MNLRTIFVMTVLGVIGVASSMAQQQQKTTGADLPSEKSLSPTMTAKDALLEKAKVNPMEGPVDPAAYIVGPSDQLYLVLSGPLSFMQLVQVTPEGTLIIPTVGEIRVAGETLGRTKEIVSQEVRKKYKLGQVTLTLVSLREFVVTLRGAVLREGKYVVSAVDRVEKVLTLGASVESPRPSVTIPLGSPRWGDPLGDRQEEIPKYRLPSTIDNRASLRNIRVIRKNRDTIRVDLLKYNVTGDDRYNPVLLDGDLITVPQRNLSQNFITIDGAVNAPGRYEYVEGDDLMTILTIAQGLTMTADSSRVVIARQNEKGELYQELTVDVNSTLGKKTTSPLVHRGDRITVRFRSYEQKNYQVILSGQIHAPGIYPISRKSTKLSKIVRDAGGLNNDALLKGSVLLRKEDRMEGLVDPRFDMTQLARANNFRSADSTYYYTEFEIGRYPVVVDFVKLFVEHDSTQDIVLRDGDILYIASNEQTVLVQGQVARSGYVAFVPGARSEYYVRSTGGFSDLAEIGEIKIIKRGSFDWVDPDKTTIDPGDRIWVPKKPRREFEYYFRIVSDVASILAAVATTVLLTIRITQ